MLWWCFEITLLPIKSVIPFYTTSIVWNVIQFVLIVCPSWDLPKYIKTKVLRTCFCVFMSFLKNEKRGPELVFLLVFIWFPKSISHAMFYKLAKFHRLTVFNFWDINPYVYCNYFPVYELLIYEMNFLI